MFFDENHTFGPRAKAWYPVIRAMMEEEALLVAPIEPFFRSDTDVLPLQAADLMAWIARNKKTKGLGKFSWISSELNQVKISPMSKTLDAEMIESFKEKTFEPELMARREMALNAYRETFGFDWPPANKPQKKRHREVR